MSFRRFAARKLVLTEQPQVARDLARVLGVTGREQGTGAFANDAYVITWCIGHLVELCEPHEYNTAWKTWSLANLPITPQPFRLRPIAKTASQWHVVKKWLQDQSLDSVINACDAGREGELIFRLCYELAGCRLPVWRLWISSLTEQAIADGFARLRPGRDFDSLAQAARCRQQADWLVGMNATRAVTVWRTARQGTLYSVGRVQTPTLALLFLRDKQIQSFVPTPYSEVHAMLCRKNGEAAHFEARWQLGKHHRLGCRKLAEELVCRDETALLTVEHLEEKRVFEPPPLLFDLTALQRTCNRRFGWSAQQTLSRAQTLYEQRKLISYPRTDSRHLGKDVIPLVPQIFRALAQLPAYAPFATRPAAMPRRVFQDQKVTDHHAIIPTTTALSQDRALTGDEAKLHDLIVRRFLGAFFPDAEFAQTTLTVRAEARGHLTANTPVPDAEGRFAELPPPPDRYFARGKRRLCAGWQQVAGFTDSTQQAKDPGSPADLEPEDNLPNQTLPALQIGEPLLGEFVIRDKETRPPPKHTEASLLSAMENAGHKLADEQLRQAMKDAGLGTPATRASVIETLLGRGYIVRHGKQLETTLLGQELIEHLPDQTLASPQLTGEWEARLNQMARGSGLAADFMSDIVAYVDRFVALVRQLPQKPPAPTPGGVVRLGPRKRRGARQTDAQTAPFGGKKARPTARKKDVPKTTATPRQTANRAAKTDQTPPPGTLIEPNLRCPLCRKAWLIWGKQAWGCADHRLCPFRVSFAVCEHKVGYLQTLVARGRAALPASKPKRHLVLQLETAPYVTESG